MVSLSLNRSISKVDHFSRPAHSLLTLASNSLIAAANSCLVFLYLDLLASRSLRLMSMDLTYVKSVILRSNLCLIDVYGENRTPKSDVYGTRHALDLEFVRGQNRRRMSKKTEISVKSGILR